MRKLTTSVLVVALTSSFAMLSAQTKPKDTAKTTDIEGVVVTALGIKREQKALGYATTKIDSDDLTKTASQNVVNSLSGRVSGLQVISSGGAPGMASRLVIRGGAKSLTNSNEPLYVIDGVPISNADDGTSANTVEGMASPNRAADINPDDIENVTILKGAAGAVLYGNRGSNGVIIITTKSGKSKAGRPVIEFSTKIGIDNALRLPDYQTAYAQGTNGDYAEGTSYSWGPKITGQTVSSLGAGAGLGLPAQNVVLSVHDPRKAFLKTGITRENNISLSNGFENGSSVFFSAGHSLQTSIIPNQEYEKFNFRFNGNFKLTDRFNAGFNLSYNKSNGNMPYIGQDGSNPIFALFHVPVSWDLNGYGYQRPDGRQINFRGGAFNNPLWSVYKNFATTESNRYIGSVNLGYDLTKWLKLTYRVGNDYFADNRIMFRDVYSGGNPNGALAYDDVTRQELTSTFMANANFNISDDIQLTAIVGQDYNQRKFRQSIISGSQLVLPGIANTNNIQTFNPGYNYISKRTLFGLFGDVTLSYKNYLFLNVVARQEWSSTLPVANRSFFYPGGSLSFVFNDALDINKDIMNYGKVRFGVSRTARDANPYLVFNTYAKGIFGDGFTDGIEFPFNGLPGYTYTDILKNQNLKPEFTTEYEVGTDLRFLRDRIGLEFTYFKNVNTDGIIPLSVSPASGSQQTIVNSGKTTSSGIEAMLRFTPIKSEDFKWDISLNFSKIKSLVNETYPGVDQIFLGGFDGNPAIFAVKGQRYGSIIGSKYSRSASGQILVDDEGYPLLEEGANLGYVEPDWTGGISTSFKYKGLYLSALLDIRHGGYIYNGTEQLLDTYGVSAKTLSRDEAYVFPGVNANTGAANNVVLNRDMNWYAGGAYPNEEYVYKNNWVKLREVTIGYSFKLPGIDYIRNVDFGLYGRNLALWTKVPHIDPESSSFGVGNAQGASRMAFPTTRSFGFSLKVQF